MPGFILSNLDAKIALDHFPGEQRKAERTCGNWSAAVHTRKQFAEDKVFEENEDYLIATEGVLLNKQSLVQSDRSLGAMIWQGFQEQGAAFFNTLIGSYSGVILDKKAQRLIAWTNHTGESAVFYHVDGEHVCVASEWSDVADTLKRNGIPLTFHEDAAYSMLTYGYMYDEMTFAKEIRRLFPGTCLIAEKGDCKIESYWTLTGREYDFTGWSEDQIIDKVDEKFRAAVKLEFDKDLEYGYDHIADLSGGLDARMVNWVAKDMGYGPVLNVHYSQADSNEEKITKQLAQSLGNILLLRPLNDISFVYDVDKLVSMNYGLSLYTGITGGESLLRSLNFDRLGIEHTGMIGDVVIGSFLKSANELHAKQISGLYSSRLSHRITSQHIQRYENFEIQKIYIRGLLGASSSFMIRKHYAESYAPFLNPDLLAFCLSIPAEYRIDHKLYKKWILKKYLAAAEAKWTSTDAKLTAPAAFVRLKHLWTRGWAIVLDRLKIKKDSFGMNPFSYWYATDSKFRDFYQTYYRDHIGHAVFSESLTVDMKQMFEQGTAQEKSQVLTVLSAANLYFS